MAWLRVELEGRPFLLRIEVEEVELTYSIFLTDLERVWSEVVKEGQFGVRWRKHNSELEGMEEVEGLREVAAMVGRMGEGVRAEVGEEEVSLTLAWVSEGLPLHYSVTLTRADPALLYRAVTRPLLSSLSSLLSQRSALTSLLRAKDLELEDLRAGGATLSVPHLATPWHNQEAWLKEQEQQEVADPLALLSCREVAQLMALPRRAPDPATQETPDSVDGAAAPKARSKAPPAAVSGPPKLSYKRPPGARPDLSKYRDKTGAEKKAKLDKL